MNSSAPEPVRPAHGLRRLLYVALGLFFVALAVLGALLPILPCTPFVLLASASFVRSSPRLHRWLLHSRLFGPMLRDWQRYRGVRRRVKVMAVGLILVSIAASIYFGQLRWPFVALLVGLALIGLTVIWRLPVVPADAELEREVKPTTSHSNVGQACGLPSAPTVTVATIDGRP